MTNFFKYILSILSGLVLAWAMHPDGVDWLVWSFPVLFLIGVWDQKKDDESRAKRGRRAFARGYLAGFSFWFINVWWIGEVSQQGGWVSVAALSAYLSLYFAAFAVFINFFTPQFTFKEGEQPALKILGTATIQGFAWVGLEWLRGLGRISFGWDGLGVPFIESGFIFAQFAEVIGLTGLSFFPIFFGCCLVLVARSFVFEAKMGKRRVHWEVITLFLVICGLFAFGTVRLQQLRLLDQKELKALVIQQNVSISFISDAKQSMKVYEGYQNALKQALEEIESEDLAALEKQGSVELRTPELVIFPESAFPGAFWADYKTGKLLEQQDNLWFLKDSIFSLGDFAFALGVNQFAAKEVAEGSWSMNEDGPFYNAIGYFFDGIESYQMTAKNHLVPFGEYMPFKNVPFFGLAYEYSAGAAFGGDFTAGLDFRPVPFQRRGHDLSIIPTVCYEDSVSSLVRKFIRYDQPQFILNVTNDGWFAGTSCMERHFRNARFRSIETRRSLVRAANTGVSAIVDYTGSTVYDGKVQELRNSEGDSEVKGYLAGKIPYLMTPQKTVFLLCGYLFAPFCFVAISVFSLVKFIFIKRSRK